MKRVLLAVVALLALTLSASNTSSFPFGVYSYLGNKKYVYENRNAFIAWMDSLSYNSNIVELFPNYNQNDGVVYPDGDFSTFLGELDSHDIDAIVTDRCWTSPLHHSTYPLSKSNHVQIEAEFKDETYPSGFLNFGSDDQYWYCSNRIWTDESNNALMSPVHDLGRVGFSFSDANASGTITWLCVPDSTAIGYAYGDMQSRWAVNPGNYPLVRDMIRVQKPYTPLDDSHSFFISYRIRLDNMRMFPEDIPLAYFRTIGYNSPLSQYSVPIPVTPLQVYVNTPSGVHILQDGVLKYSDFVAIGSPQVYFDVIVQITYSQLRQVPPIQAGSGGLLPVMDDDFKIFSLNPRLFWYGNCRLYLDYIKIDDYQYKQLESPDAAFIDAIRNRVRYVTGLGANIKGIYTFDEPTQAQFNAYQKIKQLLDITGVVPMTAVNRRGSNFVLPNGETYNHYKVFKESTDPKIIMPDPYPITGLVDWSSVAIGTGHFQTEIDSMVTSVYDSVSRICSADALSFYPVVQAFGHWNGNVWSSSFMRPPHETQKMLMYLPLCFGADGIFNYRLFGYHANGTGEGDYCAMYCNQISSSPILYDAPVVDRLTSDALLECNPRVLKYGELLNATNVTWDLAATLHPFGLIAVNTDYPPLLSQYGLSSISLSDEQLPYYKGFVQTGFYSSSTGIPHIMLVNRRSNYFVTGATYTNANEVPPGGSFASYFPAFPSQHVRLTPSASAPSQFGTQDVAFIDPYDFQIYKRDGTTFIDVEIGPGDGKLLQMAGTPALVENQDVTASSLLAIKGALSVNSGSTFTITPGTKSYVDENTVIRVMNNATMIIEGDVHVGRNAQFKVDTGGT